MMQKQVAEIQASSRHLYLAAAVLAIAGVSLQAFAIGNEDVIRQQPLQPEFNKLDIDQDKKLSPNETLPDSDLEGNFTLADTDGDGVLVLGEYNAFKSAKQQQRIIAYLDDGTITAKVKAEIIRDAGMKGLDISVETLKGQVILSGFVDNADQARRAEQIASGVRGVQSVKNALIVKG